MSRNGLNMTNGIFDLAKESEIVGNIVVDALMYPKIIKKGDDDRATEILMKEFVAFRQNLDPAIAYDQIDPKLESDALGAIVVDAFIDAGLVLPESRQLAFEIIAEEILVRRVMESL